MMTDPVADCLTRIRNAARTRKGNVAIPRSKMKESILAILQREGFLSGYDVQKDEGHEFFNVTIRYADDRTPILQGLRRVSRPGRRVYRGAEDFKPVLNGMGFSIISTSAGILTDVEARQKKVGGEVLCEVW